MTQTASDIMTVQCVVACTTDTGPDLVPYKVRCTREQYEAGQHGGAAEEQARRDGCDPCLVFTPDDPPTWLFPQMDWEQAALVNMT